MKFQFTELHNHLKLQPNFSNLHQEWPTDSDSNADLKDINEQLNAS